MQYIHISRRVIIDKIDIIRGALLFSFFKVNILKKTKFSYSPLHGYDNKWGLILLLSFFHYYY